MPLLVHYQTDTLGYGGHHVASPEGRYGSVHSTTSENENTGISGIKDVRVLFIAGVPSPSSWTPKSFVVLAPRFQYW